jgi:hypothetical protein
MEMSIAFVPDGLAFWNKGVSGRFSSSEADKDGRRGGD